MSNAHAILQAARPYGRKKPAPGFSLVELMVAMSVFLVVGGAAVALVRRHAPLFNSAQNQAGLNITLRNAVAQLQMEVVNAGTGYSTSSPVPFWPVGMTISPAVDNTCKATRTYTSTCYDTLTLINADTTLPPLSPGDATGTNSVDTTKTTDIYLTFPGNPAAATSNQYDAWAGKFKAGDEIMLIQGGTDMVAGQPAITVLVLAQDGIRNGNAVQLKSTGVTQTITLASGGCPGAVADITGIPPATDPLKIYDAGECLRFTGTFNPALDYAIRLNATIYSVDTTDAANPKLVRTGPTGVPDVIAEQIVGFSVAGWSSNTNTYSNVPGDYKSDWASLRSLQIQLVARATPNTDNASSFQNSYDQGPYQVQGMSVVINPRNLNTN
jgi:prepilin-type N-terminal cleavage/methylation domain-containing protein